MRFSNNFCDFGFNLNHLSVILSGQDTRFFPERLTGAVGKGFLMVKAITNLENLRRITIPRYRKFLVV